MDEIETRMREVLLALEMTSNGRTATFDSSGGGEPDYVLVDDDGRAKLGHGDAPHLIYIEQWASAGDDEEERRHVLERAKDELDRIRRSHADPTKAESKQARDRRIIKEGEGFVARDVANAMRCGVTDVYKARQANGRDIEFGELPQNGRALSLEERNTEILKLYRRKLSTREIALRLNIARSSVRYVLARNK